MTVLRKVLNRQMSITELRHHLGTDIVTMAVALFESVIARDVITLLAVFCITYPVWRIVEAFQSGLILISVPLYFLFVPGALFVRAALIWGQRGER